MDVEWKANFTEIIGQDRGRRVVLSMHDFDGVPDDLVEQARAMRSTGAEIIKLAVKTTRLSDCLPLLDLGVQIGRDGALLIGMGECGLATRVLAKRFGSRWTYAGSERQVGQLTPGELRDLYRFPSVSETTEVYGLVGSPLTHSASPAMHNAAFGAVGLDAVYLPFPAADADDFVTFARAFRVRGASVTIPFKVALCDRVDEADAVARRIGAINTIREIEGRWIGGNTDAAAFLRPLREHVPLAGLRVAVLGAGGSARAVVAALGGTDASVSVHARNRARAEELAITASGSAGPMPPEPGSWDVLVNCTPVGMFPNIDATPVEAAALTGRYVYDLIYNPTTTRLLRSSRSEAVPSLTCWKPSTR